MLHIYSFNSAALPLREHLKAAADIADDELEYAKKRIRRCYNFDPIPSEKAMKAEMYKRIEYYSKFILDARNFDSLTTHRQTQVAEIAAHICDTADVSH
jgi:hypothetical protein